MSGPGCSTKPTRPSGMSLTTQNRGEGLSSEGYRLPDVALSEGRIDPEVEAWVVPPVGWELDPPKVTGQHIHKTWLSPTRDTAYGVILFKLPIPIGYDLALWGFMREMRRSEGEAVLLDKLLDSDLPGMRFEAEGGRYHIRAWLTTSGFRGWCAYAGTLRGQEVRESELRQAIAAREKTRFGRAAVERQSKTQESGL